MIDLTLPLTGAMTALGGLNWSQGRKLAEARRDPVTGLATRHLWTSQAHRALHRRRGLVLLMLDGDGFKGINDTHGHPAGDALLATFATRMQRWAGPRAMAGRLGGDEFAILAPMATGEELAGRLDELCAVMAEPVPYQNVVMRAGASIGAAVVDELAVRSLPEAMHAADVALYAAKAGGRGTWRLAEPGAQPDAISTTPERRVREYGPAGGAR